MKAVDRAYLAATLDCEGSLSVVQGDQGPGRKDKVGWRCHIEVTNCNPALILWLSDKFEDSQIDWRDRGGNRKTVYAWRIYGKNCKQVLNAAYPYMILKKEQAELMLRFIETLSPSGSRIHRVADEVKKLREKICIEMAELNRRGSYA